MAVQLIVNGNTYNYPEAGEDPQWGEDASAWAVAVTDTLSTLSGTNDILNSTATIANNVSVAADINGLLFNPTNVRSALIQYSVYRASSSTLLGNAESGVIELVYDNNASSGSRWITSQIKNGDAGIVFSILDSGQVQYISTNIGATSYVGTMKFSAKTFTQ